jgi:hypothetical protein
MRSSPRILLKACGRPQVTSTNTHAPSRAHAWESGGSRARQGPRIVMRTMPRRTARRLPTGARCRGRGATRGTARDGGRAPEASSNRRGATIGGGWREGRGIPDTSDSRLRDASPSTRRLSIRLTKLISRITAMPTRMRSCARVIGPSYGLGPAGGSSPVSAMASRIVVSAWTFFIR